MSGYNLDGITMFKLTGKMAEVMQAVARSMEIRLRQDDVLDTAGSCTEISMMRLFTNVVS